MTTLRRIAGRPYVLGLSWMQLPNKGRRADVANVLSITGATHAVKLDRLVATATLERGGFLQYSAATALNEAHSSSWLGAWDISFGQWYVAAGGPNGIPPDGDRVFENEGDARAHFDEQYNRGSWTTLYAPSDWNIQKADKQALALRIEGFKGKAVLPALYWRTMQPIPLAITAASIGVAAVVIYTAWTWSRGLPAAPVVIAPEAPEVSPLAEQPSVVDDTHVVDERSHAQAVPIAHAIDSCLAQEAMVFDARVYGWLLVGWACDGRVLTAHLQPRRDAPISAILSVANKRWRSSEIGGDVDVDVPFIPAQQGELHGVAQTREATVVQLQDVAVRLGLKVQIEPISPDTHGKVHWTMTGKTPPDGLAQALFRAGPTELASMEHSFQDLGWQIRGVTYVEG